MKVITAQEALKDYARYAVVDEFGKTCRLFWNLEHAEREAQTLCTLHKDGVKYEVALIAY